MLEFLKKRFGRGDGPFEKQPAGAYMLSEMDKQAAELIFRAVSAQLAEANYPRFATLGRHRPTVLGYTAALAEDMATRMGPAEAEERYLALALAALHKLTGDSASALSLIDECNELGGRQDADYARGGTAGRDDLYAIASRTNPQRLSECLRAP
ncbi:MAG: hypothetical protein EOO27_09410 [Comamonadaceae bacterium]|nr:MAG: hypothetical protein EOO27_09410 [Comamonadaceae bacterium]